MSDMNKEFVRILSGKLIQQAEEFREKANKESNALTSASYNQNALLLYAACGAFVETFNELERTK